MGRSRLRRIRTQGGFSLIELIVVLVLIGVAIAVTAPNVFRTLERVRIRAAVKEIASVLRYGRSMAISKKREMNFYIDFEEQFFWMVSSEAERAFKEYEKGALEEQEEDGLIRKAPTIKKHRVNSLIKVELFATGEDEIDYGTIRITYSPFGNSTGGMIKIITAKEMENPISFEITIDPVTGRVKVKELKDEFME